MALMVGLCWFLASWLVKDVLILICPNRLPTLFCVPDRFQDSSSAEDGGGSMLIPFGGDLLRSTLYLGDVGDQTVVPADVEKLVGTLPESTEDFGRLVPLP